MLGSRNIRVSRTERMQEFIVDSILKTDEFSESQKGHFADAPGRVVIRRIVHPRPLWYRPLSLYLLHREARALAAVSGLPGVPELILSRRDELLRSWQEGETLDLARPADPRFYREAAAILRRFRRAGVTHNDLAKPQNWLVTDGGGAAVIDFQLARHHRRRGLWFRLCAYDDLRHLMKQKRAYAPGLMTPAQWRLVKRRSLPARLWMRFVKPIYNFVTRRILNWSDGEGQGGRLERDGPATRAALLALPEVGRVELIAYTRPGRRAGLCAICEVSVAVSAGDLLERQQQGGGHADRVVTVAALPADARGAMDMEALRRLAEAAEEPAPA